jgi:hypothetical protein
MRRISRFRLFVSIPVDGNLKKNLNNLKLADGRSLSPVDELLEVFSGKVTKKHVHIVIKVPAGELETHWPQQQF